MIIIRRPIAYKYYYAIVPSSSMPYDLNSSSLFLTYPQCPLDKQMAYDELFKRLQPQKLLVAQEKHKNGDLHLHVYAKLASTYRTKDPTALDLLGYHGNYQGCRSAKNVLKYCTKEEDYIASFDVAEALGTKSTRKEAMQSLILGKRTLEELVVDEPQFLYGYSKLKMDLLNYQKDTKSTKENVPAFLPNPWGKVLPTAWSRKCRHFWLYSERPNVGKSYLFARPLAHNYRTHIRVGSEPYWDLRGDEQLVILDEYNHCCFRYDQLNAMCDGNFQYRIFMGGIIRLNDPILIVLSNRSIQDMYPNMYHLLHARFNERKLD